MLFLCFQISLARQNHMNVNDGGTGADIPSEFGMGDIANTLHLTDIAMATIFRLSIYRIHIGDPYRIRLNRLCAAAMRPYVKLL